MKLLSIVAASLALLALPAQALELITAAEAQLPSAYQETKRAGLTRGPGIDVASPTGAVKKDALALKLDFKSRGGVPIDPASVKITYQKEPAVDLTERVRSHISASGISLEGAQVPAGEHQLRVEVSDTEGRTSSKLLNFKAE